MATMGVRHRNQVMFLEEGEEMDDTLQSPSRIIWKPRQPSRSPRSSPNQGNPYSAPAPQRTVCQMMAGVCVVIASLCALAASVRLVTTTTTTMDPSSMLRRVDAPQNTPPPSSQSSLARTHPHHSVSQPRVYHLYGDTWGSSYQPRTQLLHPAPITNTTVQQVAWQPPHPDHCLPKADWQTASYPNCNSLHEIGMTDAATLHHHDTTTANTTSNPSDAPALSILGQGWFRTTWKLETSTDAVVLKTLRPEREYLSEYYELHRRDAVAMERLTASPFVVNVFGYCGQSAINELADFPYEGVQSLETFNRRMRGKETAKTNSIKLRLAASVALGLADIHAAGADEDDPDVYMVHYDLNPRNIALFAGGRPKINDYNIAEFLRYDPATNRTCPFPSRLHEPWWRAPEEMDLSGKQRVDEKVDVYALGNILYHTLTTHSARGKQRRERMDEVRPVVAAGIRPDIPDGYRNSNDTNVLAIVDAIDLCWEKDPTQRASAEEVAAILYDALVEMKERAPIQEKEMDEPPVDATTDATDDDAPDAEALEDKDAMGHAVA